MELLPSPEISERIILFSQNVDTILKSQSGLTFLYHDLYFVFDTIKLI